MILFKYEKIGLICFKCAYLGHNESAYTNPSFVGGASRAFADIEGYPIPTHVSSTNSYPARDLGRAFISSPEQPSPIHPKNLLADLEEGLLGSGSIIAQIDQEQGIQPIVNALDKTALAAAPNTTLLETNLETSQESTPKLVVAAVSKVAAALVDSLSQTVVANTEVAAAVKSKTSVVAAKVLQQQVVMPKVSEAAELEPDKGAVAGGIYLASPPCVIPLEAVHLD